MASLKNISFSSLRNSLLPNCRNMMISSACRNVEKQPSYDNNKLIMREFKSRNPRNLEFLRIAHKPMGYQLDKPGRAFWNKLVITSSRHSVRGQIIHYSGVVVVSATSAEWGIQKQLYRSTDSCAFVAVAKVLASRAQECGITNVYSNYTAEEGTKLDLFLKALESAGLSLKEGEQYKKPDIFKKIQQTPPSEDLNIM